MNVRPFGISKYTAKGTEFRYILYIVAECSKFAKKLSSQLRARVSFKYLHRGLQYGVSFRESNDEMKHVDISHNIVYSSHRSPTKETEMVSRKREFTVILSEMTVV
jgi:hypothetical protein